MNTGNALCTGEGEGVEQQRYTRHIHTYMYVYNCTS
jgi:hypothetical protein